MSNKDDLRIIDLNGSWTLTHIPSGRCHPARVPGSVHKDLLAANAIEDPFYRDREDQLRWIGSSDWQYERTFDVSEDVLAHANLVLRCEGLDTLAEIRVNEERLASADNMYRTWEFDLKSVLKPGENSIRILFQSPLPVMQAGQAVRKLFGWHGPREPEGRAWIRKEPCNFGWDWGPVMISCGIWRPISIQAWNGPRFENVLIRQEHETAPNLVRLNLTPEIRSSSADSRIQVRAILRNETVASAVFDCDEPISLLIHDPELWWPNNMGEQPLYEIELSLIAAGGGIIDRVTRKIGLRTLKLDRHPDAWGESFQFVVNGVPFFAKGANWIPGDAVPTRMTRDSYLALIQAAADANMNMLRVWGGGIYEEDCFYDICDELGICVWQDFMFACSGYPTFDDSFMSSVEEEARDNIRRIRHHACLALWCGNNELEQGLVGPEWSNTQMSWSDYSRLFDQLLPTLVQELDPDRDYWPCSPHTPRGDRTQFNDPTSGDAHLWSVWHGREPFEWYRTCTHRFNSEFGFQSFPEPRTAYAFTQPGDRNITSYVMEHHQRSGIGNTLIMQYMLEWFRLPDSFENTLWLSQILQGMAMKYAVEHWRRSMPRGMGTLYWQLNDCWPVASWASIDFFGRWKALHYMARHFFAPTLLSALENVEDGSVSLHITNDQLVDQSGEVGYKLMTLQGEQLETGWIPFNARANANTQIEKLDLKEYLEKHGPRNLIFWAGIKNPISCAGAENLVLFSRPKHLDLPETSIRKELQQDDHGLFSLTLQADTPVLWAWVESTGVEATFSDNFFHLVPGRPRSIRVSTPESVTQEELENELRISHLADTYSS
jgi:beta-mannosidase